MKRTILFVAGTTLLASSALANPYATEVLRARMVPGPHVQLTYGKDSSYFPFKDPSTPTQVTTYGTTKTSWTSEKTYYRTNTGSGVVSVSALQMCDCYVPIGQALSYTIMVPSLRTEGQFTKLTASTQGRPAPSSTPDGGLNPWDIPDPTEVQGLDCSKTCVSETQPSVDAAVPAIESDPSSETKTASSTMTATANKTPSTIATTVAVTATSTVSSIATSSQPSGPSAKTTSSGGACTAAPAGKPAAAGSLVLLFALALIRRRRS